MALNMALVHGRDNTTEVVEKVLRRVEVAKVARSLQDRLALATFKAQNGWQNLPLSTLEAEVGEKLKRKRTNSIGGMTSDSTSSGSDIYDRRNHTSSPLTAPIFSDDIQGPGGTYKRPSYKNVLIRSSPPPSSHQRIQSNPTTARKTKQASRRSLKSSRNPPGSSLVLDRQPSSNQERSWAALGRQDKRHSSPVYDSHSDNEFDPIHSFHVLSSSPPRFSPTGKSPPRTPPPNRTRSARTQKGSGRSAAGEEGADLLLYLASSPSPAHRTNTPAHGHVSLPSTPPSQPALPSSMMTTPGGGNLFGLSTPGQNFNFADFVNVTPSPAQAPWGGRTPGLAKTPLAAKEARRRLNFDNLVPPTGGNGSQVKVSGLALQLGEELRS